MKKRFTPFIVFFISFLIAPCAVAQLKMSGKVSDPEGNPLADVSVEVVGKTTRSATDEAGFYTIAAQAGDELEFSFVGLESVRRKVESSGPIDVRMRLDKGQELKEVEVVAVAYGSQKREAITGSVSTVDKKILRQVQAPNVLKNLEGAVAGLQISQGSGQPGSAASSVLIRGIGSISAETAPLIVLDGAPYSGDLSSINSNDIEQISVLKDAASTALYGHRAANGVIIVTTKRGKKGALSITLDSRVGFNQRMLPQYDIITDPKEYYETYWMALRNGYILNNKQTREKAGLLASGKLINDLVYNAYRIPEGEFLVDPNTGKLNPKARLLYNDDWGGALFKNKLRQEQLLSVRGGSKDTRYIFSLGYLKDGGVTPNSGFDRLSARIGLDQDLREWLKVGGTLSYTNTVQRNSRETGGYGNAFFWTRSIAPIYPIYLRDAQGGFVYDEAGDKMYDWGTKKIAIPKGGEAARPYGSRHNPIGAYKLNRDKRTRDSFWGSFYAKAKFLKDFEWSYVFTAEGENYNQSYFITPLGGDAAQAGGRGEAVFTRESAQTHQTFLKWNKKWRAHALEALIGADGRDYAFSALSGMKENFFLPEGYVLDFAGKIMALSNYERDYKTRYLLSRLEYDYASKYYISASFSRGASSVFHKDKRWGNFYGIGLAWRLSQESFMTAAKGWLNELKIKASYGERGNDAITYKTGGRNYFPYIDQYQVNSSDGIVSSSLFQIGNPNLTWEKKRDLNIGLEFSLLNRRLSGSLEYYISVTTNLLYNKPQDPTTGRPYLPINIGSLQNRGIDLQLGLDLIRSPNVDWRLNLTASHVKNKILSLDPSAKGGVIDDVYKLVEGRSLRDYYLRSFAGVDPNTGEAQYWMDQEDGSGKETGARVKTVEYAAATLYFQNKRNLPDLYGGLQSYLRIKNFDFSLGFSYSIGGYAIDEAYRYIMGVVTLKGRNFHRDASNSWSVDNPNSKNPVLAKDYFDGARTSNRFLIDASWLSLSNISVGYTLNQDWVKSYGLSSLRIYAMASNVFLWSARKGFDPRLIIGSAYDARLYSKSGLYPAVRTFSLGVKLDF